MLAVLFANAFATAKNEDGFASTALEFLMENMIDVDAVARAVVNRIQRYTTLTNWPEGKATLNEAEAAAYIGIGTDFLRELRQTKQISHRKIGRRIVYTASDIGEFLEGNRSPAKTDLLSRE